MRFVHSFRIPARILIGLWVGIIFLGSIAYAQERPIDTLPLFNIHADMVRMDFKDTLHIAATDSDAFRYAYRWNINGQDASEDNALDLFLDASGENALVFFQEPRGENALDFSFTGQRKNKIKGNRVAPSARSYHFDITPAELGKNDTSFTQEVTDTVYLEAFPDYANDNNVFWLWIVNGDTLSDTGPQIRLTASKDRLGNLTRVDCFLQTENEAEVRHIVAWIGWFYVTGKSIYLPENKDGHSHHLYIFNQKFDHIYCSPNDTLYLDAGGRPDEIHEDSIRLAVWHYSFGSDMFDTAALLNKLFFRGARDRDYIYVMRYLFRDSWGMWNVQGRTFVIHWELPEIETDSVWVFFPQYPYSNLGGVMDICWPPDAPLPAAEDTVYTFNLGPWNRELEYVEYAWFDGTKTASGGDSVVGTDSVFYYTFGKMDSVAPDLYAGTLVTRVASDSLWQDTCGCYIPCTDAACSGYDTVQIYLHLLPSLRENVFLPRDSVLCAHLDLELTLPDTAADAYRCFWLDRDSIEMPYGHDTARFTVEGMRGLDGYGAGTDTREPRLFQLRLDHKICGVSFFDTLLVYDQVKPAFTLPFHDTIICRNEPVELDSLSPHVYRPFYTFEWNDGKKGSDYSFTDSGTYVLRFFINKDFAFCGYDTASDTLRTVWVDPAMTDIHLPSDTIFCKDLSVTLDVRVPFPSTRYSWQEGPMPDPEEDFEEEQDSIIFTSPIKTIRKEGTYNVLLLDSMGCRNRQEIEVTIDDCKPAIDIPNVFTPNGDGVNDVWRFKQLEKCTDVVIEVVDRWGQPVLKKKVPSAADFEWNGRVNNTGTRLPDGPYFYMVTYKNLYGKSKVQSGSITILGTSE